MSSRTRSCLASVVLVSLCGGCATSYKPRPSPKVAIVMEGGAPAVEKNGTTTKIGPFGGGLVEAVEGVPDAEEHAGTYRGRMIGGFVMNLVAAPVAGLGAGLLIYNEGQSPPSDGLRGASFGMLFGGLALSLAGSILMATAQPHFWDAINVYNDTVQPGPMPMPVIYPPGAPPPGAPPIPSAPPGTPTPAPPATPPTAPPPPGQAPSPPIAAGEIGSEWDGPPAAAAMGMVRQN
jgi:hypothetical protein